MYVHICSNFLVLSLAFGDCGAKVFLVHNHEYGSSYTLHCSLR